MFFVFFLAVVYMHIARISPEHLVQFIGGHAAAIVGESQTKMISFIIYIDPDLFRGHTGIWCIVYEVTENHK